MPEFAARRAVSHPDEVALRDADQTLRWADVDDAVNRAADALLARQLGPSRRVAVFAENSATTALAHLGGLFAGASNVPTNFHLTATEAAYIFSDSGAEVVFVGPETLDRGVEAARLAGIDTVVAWGSPPAQAAHTADGSDGSDGSSGQCLRSSPGTTGWPRPIRRRPPSRSCPGPR